MYKTFSLFRRGVQRTEEPKKPPETDRTVAKISVRFWFHFLKTKIFGFDFSAGFFNPETDKTNLYIYIHVFAWDVGFLLFNFLKP